MKERNDNFYTIFILHLMAIAVTEELVAVTSQTVALGVGTRDDQTA